MLPTEVPKTEVISYIYFLFQRPVEFLTHSVYLNAVITTSSSVSVFELWHYHLLAVLTILKAQSPL